MKFILIIDTQALGCIYIQHIGGKLSPLCCYIGELLLSKDL